MRVVCYTAVFSAVTQRGGALRDDTKNGCVADYHEGDTFIYPHLHQQNQSVGTRNNVEYNGFIVPLKKNYFLLVAGAPHQNYCIRVFISYGPTPNLGPVYMEWGTPV